MVLKIKSKFLVSDVDKVEGDACVGSGDTQEIFSQLCYKPKTALKN